MPLKPQILIVCLMSFMVCGSCGTKQEVVEMPKPIQGGEYIPEHSKTVFLVMYDAEDVKLCMIITSLQVWR